MFFALTQRRCCNMLSMFHLYEPPTYFLLCYIFPRAWVKTIVSHFLKYLCTNMQGRKWSWRVNPHTIEILINEKWFGDIYNVIRYLNLVSLYRVLYLPFIKHFSCISLYYAILYKFLYIASAEIIIKQDTCWLNISKDDR